MICVCFYCPEKDLAPIDQFGFVSLVECFNNLSIPADISDTSDQYNDIEDPSSIVGKPSDVFEAVRMHEHINSLAKSAKSPEGDS